jgi:hypothetical protein
LAKPLDIPTNPKNINAVSWRIKEKQNYYR